MGYLPDPGLNVSPWREAGRGDLTPAVVAERLDSRAEQIVSRASP